MNFWIWLAIYECCCIWFVLNWMQKNDEKLDSFRMFFVLIFTSSILPAIWICVILGKLLKRNNGPE